MKRPDNRRTIESRSGRRPAGEPTSGGGRRGRTRRRRRGNNILLYFIVLLVMLSVGLVLVFNVFFNTQYIVVQGNTRYDDGEIIDSSGVQIGDNLFRMDTGAIAQALYERYSYFAAVKLKRELPESLVIEVEMAEPVGALAQTGGYLLYSGAGRVLEHTDELPDGVIPVSGLPNLDVKIGQMLDWKEDEELNMVRILGQAIETSGFEVSGEIQLEDKYNIRIRLKEKLVVELGSEADLEYKLRLVQKVLSEELEPDFEGTIDASSPPYVRARSYHEGAASPSGSQEEPPEDTQGEENRPMPPEPEDE